MNFLYDWQFWGVVVSVLAIISGFVIYLLQKQTKKLGYLVLTETPLLSIGEEIKGKIEIKYETKKIQNIYLLIIKIENTGNVPVASNDFEEPIKFSFPKSEILSVEVTDVSPKNLTPTVIGEISKINISPVLLNKNDFIVCKMLLAKYGNKIDVESRIIGVKEIERVKKTERITYGRVMVWSFLAAIITAGISYTQMHIESLVDVLIIPSIVVLGTIFYFLLFIGVVATILSIKKL